MMGIRIGRASPREGSIPSLKQLEPPNYLDSAGDATDDIGSGPKFMTQWKKLSSALLHACRASISSWSSLSVY